MNIIKLKCAAFIQHKGHYYHVYAHCNLLDQKANQNFYTEPYIKPSWALLAYKVLGFQNVIYRDIQFYSNY